MEHHLPAICFDFGDTLIDEATEVKDERMVTQSAELIPGVAEMLHRLKALGYRLAIVSNGPVGNVDKVLAHYGLLELFDVMAISDEIGLRKPDPAIFRWALDRLGIDPADYGRTVMVGNHLDRDVKGANATGMISVWLDWSPRYPKGPADLAEVPQYRIGTPLELLSLVQRLERELDRRNAATPVELIHHAASRERDLPPSSLAAVAACLAARARVIEVDLNLTADGDFVLLHGPLLEYETTDSGPIQARTAAELSQLRHVWRGQVTDLRVGLLGQALELLAAHRYPVEVQLDCKPEGLSDPAVLARLVERLQPVKHRVRLSSEADWLVRRIQLLDAELPVGFDPLLYLEQVDDEWAERDGPPFRRGAYGYLDDHPLASRRWGPPADYLAARAEALCAQAPGASMWYIRARLLAHTLDDGFDWMATLHERGTRVTAWTLDPDNPASVALARRLAGQGVDRITTNDSEGLARALAIGAVM
jgi:HAD superfamily hydrolase (TIGR01662 family)